MTSNRTRRLAAVWFADIVGYTALSNRDEDAALSVVDELQRLSYAAVGDKGRVVKFLGDGVLAVFASATRALEAATELRASLEASAVVRDNGCSLSIGVHVGEVVAAEDGDVYGEGVNVASRIEGVASAGQIVVSEDIYRLIRNRPEYAPRSIGAHELKGVAEPAELFLLVPSGAATGETPAATPAARAGPARVGADETSHDSQPGTAASSHRRAVAIGIATSVIGFVVLSVVVASSVSAPDPPADDSSIEAEAVAGGSAASGDPLATDSTEPALEDPPDESVVDPRASSEGPLAERPEEPTTVEAIAEEPSTEEPTAEEPALPVLSPAGDGLLALVFGEGPGVRLAERHVLSQLRQRGEVTALDPGEIGFDDRAQPAVASALRAGLGPLRRPLWERGAEFVLIGRLETSARTTTSSGFVASGRLLLRMYRVSTGEVLGEDEFTVGLDGERGPRSGLAGWARTVAADEVGKQAAAAARGWLVQALRSR